MFILKLKVTSTSRKSLIVTLVSSAKNSPRLFQWYSSQFSSFYSMLDSSTNTPACPPLNKHQTLICTINTLVLLCQITYYPYFLNLLSDLTSSTGHHTLVPLARTAEVIFALSAGKTSHTFPYTSAVCYINMTCAVLRVASKDTRKHRNLRSLSLSKSSS